MLKKVSVYPFHRSFPAFTRANVSLMQFNPITLFSSFQFLESAPSFLLSFHHISSPPWLHCIEHTALNPCMLGYAYLTVPVCSSSLDLQRFRYRCLYLWNTNQHHLPHYHPLAPGNGNEDMGKDPTGYIA